MAKSPVFTKGCGLAVVLWLLMVGAYGYVAWQKIRQPAPAAIVGVLGGTFAAMLLSSIAGLFTGGRDRAALRRAAKGEARRDGRLEAASGPVRALDGPLEAPFTGQPCVAYDYDVRRAVQGQSDFAGVAMTPCIVDAPRGPARILGWTMLDAFPAAPDERIDRSRGTRYLSTAAFEPLGVTSILSTFSELVSDDDGTIRKDFRIGGDSVDLTGRAIQERALPVGTVVTILGRWSEPRQGFVAAGTASINRLFPGDLERTRKAVGGNAVKTVATAAFFFLALHAILVPMYMLAPQSGAARARRAGSVWDERDCEQQKAMLAAGADANERGTDARTPLMNAARLGEPDCVRNLIAAGAQLEARDKFSDTAVAHAVVAGRVDNVAILLAAGATDFRVTAATGRPIPEDAAPLDAVRNYVEAVHQGDFEMMARLMAHTSVRRLEDDRANLPLWQSIRPRRFAVEKEGAWMTADAATLTIRGATPSGEQRVTYHLERREDGWQIRKEWFPDR